MKTNRTLAAVAMLTILNAQLSTARADIYGTNLVLDPGAENEGGSPTGDDLIPLLDWSVMGVNHFTVVQYGAASGILPTCPGPTNRGANCFYGGPDNAASFAYQWVDVSSVANDIDGHNVVCTLSGWLGDWTTWDDNASLTVYFIDDFGQTTGSLAVGPVLAAGRTNVSGLYLRGAATNLPPGTRTIHCVLLMTPTFSFYNNAFADNLSLTLASTTALRLALASSGNSVVFSWPLSAGNWTLQSATNLAASSVAWVDLPPPYQTNGATVSLPLSNLTGVPAQFFRLRQ